MHHSSFSTSKSAASLALAILATVFGAIALLLFFGPFSLRPLPLVLALGACVLVLVAVALRKLGQEEDATRIEPTFETSILAFPPEPKLGPRPLRRTWRPQ